jgi:hypothetical protein
LCERRKARRAEGRLVGFGPFAERQRLASEAMSLLEEHDLSPFEVRHGEALSARERMVLRQSDHEGVLPDLGAREFTDLRFEGEEPGVERSFVELAHDIGRLLLTK